MVKFAQASLTVPEAAYVAGVSERVVNREIDAQVVRTHGRKKARALSGADVLYLGAVRDIRRHMTPKLRKQMREAIAAAVRAEKSVAKIAALEVKIDSIRDEVLKNFGTLERIKRDYIESRPAVFAGAPCIKERRIPVRHVADIMRQGGTLKEMQDEYNLTPEEVEAAVIFDRVTPKRGRPPIRKTNVKIHVPADR
jgi:uncharacterized protein (DUF433 family)